MKAHGIFSPGDLVALASDRSKRGAVIGIQPGDHENRIQVFTDGSVQTFYASQLVPAPQETDTLQTATADEFRARLTALHLLHPGTASLYSLHAARVDFIPYAGQREDMVLTPVADDAALDTQLSRLLESAADVPTASLLDAAAKDRLDLRHHALWQAANTAHRKREQASIAYRKESLAGSHRARVALLQEQLAQADNAKIRRMRQAQLDVAETDFARRNAELAAASARADILASPVFFGRINITR